MALVLRGLHTHSDPQDVLHELRELGFPVVAASRLYSTVGPRKLLLLLRLVIEKGKRINQLLDLNIKLIIRVEPCCETCRVS